MKMETKKCISCKKDLSNEKESILFKCPECKKYEIRRCGECRKKGAIYVCPSCGFEGPN